MSQDYKTHLSLEVFPPKKDEEFENVYQLLRDLNQLNPDFISCTYGAGGSRSGKKSLLLSRKNFTPQPSLISPVSASPKKILRGTVTP